MRTSRPASRRRAVAATAVLLPLLLGSPAVAAGSAPFAQAAGPLDLRPESALVLTGPSGAVAPGEHRLAVRLQAGERPVRGATVEVEQRLPDGAWQPVGEVVTDADGLGVLAVSLVRTTRLRASYAGSLTTTPTASDEVTVTVADFRARAVQVAAAQKGKPYRYGSTGPDSFDCSGLVQFAFRAVGRTLPRTSREQLRATQRIGQDEVRPGDLVFTRRGSGIGHVGIYAGDGRWWVAPKTGDVVKLQRIWTTDYLVGRVR